MIRNVVEERAECYDELENQVLEAIERQAAATAAAEEKLKEGVTSATEIGQGEI